MTIYPEYSMVDEKSLVQLEQNLQRIFKVKLDQVTTLWIATRT